MESNHCPKLSPRFYGPYKIVARIGSVAYKLELPQGSLIHNVFHVSLLKKKIGDKITPSSSLPPMSTDGSPHWVPEKILNLGLFKHKNLPVVRWLIRWAGFPTEDATWEDASDIQLCFPHFQP